MGISVVLLFVVAFLSYGAEGSQDLLQKLSKNFGKALEECKKELSLPDSIDADFINFWKVGYELTDKNTGCAIMCLSGKLDMLNSDGSLHHGNAAEFAIKHGADEGMAKKLVEILHGCYVETPDSGDLCIKVLGAARCFKAEMHKLDWAPTLDLMVGELLIGA